MDFFSELDKLTTEIDSSSVTDIDMKTAVGNCKSFILKFFPCDNNIIQQLNNISPEPKGIYYPEMYGKLKSESLLDCKQSLLTVLKNAKEEYDRLLVDKPFEQIIKHSESQFLEFKSTLCWDILNSKENKKLMGEIIMKSISAFSNSEGGVLLIGISDDKKILGLLNDYKTFKNGSGNRDDFELHLTTLIINYLSKTFAKDNLSIEFPSADKEEICLIRIKKSSYPVTLKVIDKSGQPKEKFFIRINNSSRDIDNLLELARYIKQRFPNWS